MNSSYSDVLAIVLGGGRGERLYPLTLHRSKPAVPLAGKYRIVDIPLSNCINSQIYKMFVLTQYNSASLNRHVAMTYRFDNFSQGFVNTLAAEQTPESHEWFQGTADAVRQTIRHFADLSISHVLILSGDQMYQMDYRRLLDFHLESQAEITVSTIPVEAEQAPAFGIMQVDDRNQVDRFQEKPSLDRLAGLDSPLAGEFKSERFPDGRAYLASMGIYVFSKAFLIRLLEQHPGHDFGKHIIPDSIQNCRVMSFPFLRYWTDIGTIRSFYEANLDLTAAIPKCNFYDARYPIYTRARLLPGSKVNACTLDRCVVADGCFLTGTRAKHSIIGLRSRVDRNSTITRTYVMGADYYETLDQIEQNRETGIPNLGIGESATIQNAIIDKNVRIGRDVRIVNAQERQEFDGENYYVREGIVVIPKEAVIPDGTII